MLTRLVLILSLVFQPLSLGGVVASRSGGHQTSGCCTLVEKTTCCGRRVIERVCRMTDGECTCTSRPGVPEQPAPAPQQRRSDERVAVLAPRPVGDMVVPAAALRAAAPLRSRLATARSHNTARAVVGVWHT